MYRRKTTSQHAIKDNEEVGSEVSSEDEVTSCDSRLTLSIKMLLVRFLLECCLNLWDYETFNLPLLSQSKMV